MADWFIYQAGGAHLGPWSSEKIAEAIARDELPQTQYVGAPGSPRWVKAMDVPVIEKIVTRAAAEARYRGTVMMVKDEELDEVIEHARESVRPRASSVPPPLPSVLAQQRLDGTMRMSRDQVVERPRTAK